MTQKSSLKAYLAYTSVCILWGTTYTAIRIGVEHVPPFLFGGFRWLISGLAFIIFLRLSGKKFPTKTELFHLIIIGTCLLGISNGFLNFAEQWVPSGLSSLLITTVPFWIVGMELLLPNGPKLILFVALGLLLGLAGVAVIFFNDIQLIGNKDYLSGMLGLLAVVVFWSLGSVYSKYKKVGTHLLMGASIQMIAGGAVQTITGFCLGEWPRFSFDTNSLIAFLYLAVFGAIIGYSSYIYMITHLPLSFASTYAYVNPVIAIFLGWLMLDEKLNLMIIIGAVIIIFGIFLVKYGVQNQMYKKKLNLSSSA